MARPLSKDFDNAMAWLAKQSGRSLRDLMLDDATAITAPGEEEIDAYGSSPYAVKVQDVGIEFAINRRVKRRTRDLFIKGRKVVNVDKFWALRHIDLAVKPGESVGIVGANGCGKSTLLKIIAGVLKPDEGSLEVHGAIAPLIELGAGFSGELSARENVYLNGLVLGMNKEEIDERFDAIVRFAGVRRFLDTPLKHFSSGMKVRLGFAIVVQLSHPILLIDEVLAVGDRGFRRKCYTAMEEMLSSGRTLVLVSHRDADIKRFCGRALYLKQGEQVADGPVDDVLERYTFDAESE